MLKQAHIPYILACHLQIDADPDPGSDPAYHFDADPDPDFLYADPDFLFDADPGYKNDADPSGSGSCWKGAQITSVFVWLCLC